MGRWQLPCASARPIEQLTGTVNDTVTALERLTWQPYQAILDATAYYYSLRSFCL
jgi:hypothetical protein